MEASTISMLILAGLSGFSGFCFILLCLCIPRLREGPGELILGQCIAQTLLDLHWFTIKEIWPHGDSDLSCEVVGSVVYAAYVSANGYTAAICLSISQHFESGRYPSNRLYHSVVISLALGVTAVVSISGCLGGASSLGTCFILRHSWAE